MRRKWWLEGLSHREAELRGEPPGQSGQRSLRSLGPQLAPPASATAHPFYPRGHLPEVMEAAGR